MLIHNIHCTHIYPVHVTSSSELSSNTKGFENFDDDCCCCFLGFSINSYLEQSKLYGTVTVQLEYFSQCDIDQFLKDANISALRGLVFKQAHHLQAL